jgi:glycerol-3-phosphate dehydrogenase (NAD(P)+)
LKDWLIELNPSWEEKQGDVMKQVSIAIIGAGSMGTALSVLLSRNGHKVKLWSPFQKEANMINKAREQVEKLPGIRIPESVSCTADIEEALRDVRMIVLAIPSQTIRSNVKNILKYASQEMIVACFSKGLEENSGLRLSEVVLQEMPGITYVAFSGPCHAEELAAGIPTAYVAASGDKRAAERAQDIFMSPVFRVYTNRDIIGVELGGALKNVIALCAGISDGLGYGDNTKAALITRGIAEITRLGVALGANSHTFAGLAGIGDLVVTCTSMHSRNRRAGILIGKGKTVNEAISEVKMVIEGVSTARAAYNLAKRENITMPIVFEANEVLFNGKNPRDAVNDLMTRDKTNEIIIA